MLLDVINLKIFLCKLCNEYAIRATKAAAEAEAPELVNLITSRPCYSACNVEIP